MCELRHSSHSGLKLGSVALSRVKLNELHWAYFSRLRDATARVRGKEMSKSRAAEWSTEIRQVQISHRQEEGADKRRGQDWESRKVLKNVIRLQ